MRHYRIVKKTTHALIAISAFALFFNIALLCASQTGMVKLNTAHTTKAASSCSGTGVSVDLVPAATSFQVNELFGVHLKVTDTTKYYSYQLYAKDIAANKNYEKDSPFDITPADGGGKTSQISISRVGKFAIYAKYILYQDGLWCEDWASTNEVPITIGDNVTNSSNITISPIEKTEIGGYANISWNMTGALGKKFVLSISKGGECPDKPDVESCWFNSVHAVYPVENSDLTGTYGWNTSSADLGRHAATIKLFDNATGVLTDKKTVSFTVCAPGTVTNGSCKEELGATGDGDITSSSDPITVPASVSISKTFTSAFKLPNHISGAGDLITVIIKLLEYLIGVFAFIGIIVSGIQYITSGGDPAKAEKAKKTLLYCVIGIIVAVLALTIQGIIATFWGGPT